MNAVMPTMLAWVLGGNDKALRSADRQPHCRLDDKPKSFDEKVRLLIYICASMFPVKWRRLSSACTV